MDLDRLDLSADAPPVEVTGAAAALWWLARDDWQPGAGWRRAHAICQQGEGDPAHDVVHGLVHWIEGDRQNSDYWYRRAGRARQSDDARTEARAIAASL